MSARTVVLAALAVAALPIAPRPTPAQQAPPAADSLRLATLQAEARAADPRQAQLALQAREAALQQRNIAAERLPLVSAAAQAQYQSQVLRIPIQLPGGQQFPTPLHDAYDAHVEAQESLFDPSAAPRRGVVRAELAQSDAATHTALFGLQREVNDAFFAAASLQERARAVASTITDLTARLREARERFRQGAALPGDTATFAAAILQRRQDEIQFLADRRAAIARLAELTGRPLGDGAPLALPALGPAAAAARRGLDSLRARPEYAQFAAARDLLERQTQVQSAREMPRVSAFARVGYGRPGQNLLGTSFQTYWLGGVQVQWTPFTWGTVDRDRQVLEVQRQIVATSEAAFTAQLRRSLQGTLATINQLDSTLSMDDRIVALRERIEEQARAQLEEGVVTSADYVDRSTDVLDARLARVMHRVALERARADLLTTLGLEIP